MKSLVFLSTAAVFVGLLAACTGAEPSPKSAPPADPRPATAPPSATVAPSPAPLAKATTVRVQQVEPTADAAPAIKPTLTSKVVADATPAPKVVASPAPTPQPPPPTPAPKPTPVPGPQLSGRVDLQDLKLLYSRHGLPLDTALQRVSAHSLDGAELALLKTVGPDGAFAFNLPKDTAYLLNALTVDGVNLWALTSVLEKDLVQDVSLQTSYQAGIIYAAEGKDGVSSESSGALKESADAALAVGADRLVNTVKRVVNNAVLWGVDYSIVTEVDEVTLRAFGGGLEPVRSLASVLNDPEPDYVPHIYMLNTAAGSFFLDRILMSELKADRWTVIVVAEDIPPRVYRGLGGLHVVHGGTTMVYGEDKCFEWSGSKCRSFRQVLVTLPLDAPSEASPTVVTPIEDFDGAHRPQWSWDQRKIAFHAFPKGRLARAQIYVMNGDGSDVTQLTFKTAGQNGARNPSWSPDNSLIAYMSDQEAFFWDIWLMNSDGGGPRNLTQGRVQLPNEPKFSPDGRRILFYGSDVRPEGPIRGGPDKELWIMDRDGSNLRKVTDNEEDDENVVWGLNGVDVVYSVDGKTWAAANVLTGSKLFDFPGLTSGRYVSPVLAATEHVLVPTQAAIDAEQVDEKGYVKDDWIAELKAKLESKKEVKKTEGAYRVVSPSKDPLSGIRYEIFTAFTQTPIYQSDVGGWVAPIISWP